MNSRTLLVFVVVLLAASAAFAIQTGKLRVKDKGDHDSTVLDARLPDSEDAVPVNIVDEHVAEAEMNTVKATPSRKAPHTGKTGSDKFAAKKTKIAATSTPKVQAKPKAAKADAKIKTESKQKTKVPIYLRTDGLPEYAAKAKELLAAAADQSWPGEPLVQGCTPLECQQWCSECGSTATCENRCFLYSQCNDEC